MKKVLFSLLMICLVASLVGAGTWAYFSDYEHSEDNFFEGGTLDLKVNGLDDPDVATFFEIQCVKPGDSGNVEIDLCNTGCVDGTADLHLMNMDNNENGIAEPEGDVDTTPDVGELCDNLMMRISVDLNDDGIYETVIAEGAFIDIQCINWILGALDAYSCIGLFIEWWVPTTVGNIIMTDICSFDIEFSLNQGEIVAEYYDLTVISDGCCPVQVGTLGTVPAGGNATFYDIVSGTTVGLVAQTSECCVFDTWAGDVVLDPATNPNKVVMDGDKTVTAYCHEPTFDLTVNSQGCCPVVVGDLGVVPAGQSQTFQDLACGAVISLDADDSDPACTFVEWIGDVDLSPTTDPNQVTMLGDRTVTAVCQGVGWNLTLTSNGCCPINWAWDGQNGVVPAGETQTLVDVPGGTTVTVTADDSDPCCVFQSWSDGGAQSHGIVMDANKSATATCVWLESDLTVISDGCCDIQVGNLGRVAAGTTQSFFDIACCNTIELTAIPTDPLCCVFTGWTGDITSQNPVESIHLDGTNKTVTAHCVWLDSDLTVNSIGCCDVDVQPMGVIVPAGTSMTFSDIPCCVTVSATAIPVSSPGYICVCDDVVVDQVSVGCPTGSVHMDGNNHVIDVYCHEEMVPPVPEPCCWCIYDVDWWASPNAPPNPPTSSNFYAIHNAELLPPGHTEIVGDYTIVIADPSWVQITSFYQSNWTAYPAGTGPARTNPILGNIQVLGAVFFNSQNTMLNEKTIYTVKTGIGTVVVVVWTIQRIPISGNIGWPFAVGNQWVQVGASVISAPSWSYYVVAAEEDVTIPDYGSPPGPMTFHCYRVESYAWVDADGDMYPDPEEIGALSAKTWYSNQHGCYIKQENVPGALFGGYEYRYLIWYCFNPPFPPFI